MSHPIPGLFAAIVLLSAAWIAAAAPRTSEKPAKPTAAARIDVTIDKLRSNKGRVYVGLYDSPRGFPGSAKSARRSATAIIKGGKARVVFDRVPNGTYAVAALHDENANGKIDKNFIGIPSEGVGASNDAQGKFGPADYDDAKFALTAHHAVVTVRMRYFDLF
jgi:uncharacterized protein (DUF2141 family)